MGFYANDKEEAEKILIDYIEIYKDVYSGKENEILKKFVEDIKTNKEDTLKDLDRFYKVQLNISKRLGVDISEYPKSLENLTR